MEQQVQGVIQRDVSPPPYSKTENAPAQFRIRRKPIDVNKAGNDGNNKYETGGAQISTPSKAQPETMKELIHDLQTKPPSLPPRPDVIRGDSVATAQSTSRTEIPSLQNTTALSNTDTNKITVESSAGTGNWKKVASGHAQKAFQEARHFVGGLVTHPSVSNKHYSILRHSHGVVFYQGSNTFFAVSIFVDEPLPKDRTIWMQCKGWTGKTGMRAKALFGLNDSWINVTPSLAIQPDQVNASDERAWQRDIKRFRKKSLGSPQERHSLRETAIIRVPVEATDGYYQLVLCRGDQKRKVLCTSPVFRVISTSSDPSTLRGASLSTLPVELGLWVGGLYAQSTASNFVTPITSKIQSSSLMPSGTTQFAMQTAYTVSGLEDRVDSGIEQVGDNYNETQMKMFTRLGAVDVNIETGPAAPYPVDFTAKVNVQTTTSTFDMNGFPKQLGLVGISPRILQRLDGNYIAWCKLLPMGSKTQNAKSDEKSESGTAWVQCILSASTFIFQERVSNVRSEKALKVTTSIKIIEDVDIPAMAQIEVRIMGFIRPTKTTPASLNVSDSDAEAEEQIVLAACDIELTRSTLDNPSWQPEFVPATPGSENSVVSIEKENQSGIWDKAKGGYSNMRLKSQAMVDQIPFHRVGIRTATDELKDKNLAVSGYYIPR